MKYICKLCGKEYSTHNAIISHLHRAHKWTFEKGDARDLIMRVIEK